MILCIPCGKFACQTMNLKRKLWQKLSIYSRVLLITKTNWKLLVFEDVKLYYGWVTTLMDFLKFTLHICISSLILNSHKTIQIQKKFTLCFSFHFCIIILYNDVIYPFCVVLFLLINIRIINIFVIIIAVINVIICNYVIDVCRR